MIQLTEFKNLKDLLTRLGDESVARKYMEEMRWNGAPFCPHCNDPKPYKLKDGKTYRCRSKTCKKDFTVTVGTIFENSKIPLSTWIAAMYLLTSRKKGISSLQLSRDLGVTQKTSWFILHRVRLIMNIPEPKKLANVVEVDETYVGGKWENMNRGRRQKHRDTGTDNKTAVMGLLERDGNVRMHVIGKNTFKEVVRQNVALSAIVITDTHISYQGLGNEFKGHESVNHSQDEYRRGIAYTNSIEGFFSIFKRMIYGTYHQISPKHLHRYCAESTYRYNSRKIPDNERFKSAISNVEGRLKYNDLIKKTTK